jgi:hypothetical protein
MCSEIPLSIIYGRGRPRALERETAAVAEQKEAQARGGIAGGIILIGIGMLWITNWWWPGIMLVIGCALAAERFINGQLAQAVGVFALFLAIPLGIAIVQDINIPWNIVVPFVLIALGIVGVFRAIAHR